MKKTLIAAASVLSMIAAPAFAQSTATGEILLSANVQKACGVGNHKSTANADASFDQSDITVNLADNNGQFNGTEYTNRSFGNVWCNSAANVTLSAAALTTDVAIADTDSFTNKFDLEIVTDAAVYTGRPAGYALKTADGTNGVVSINGSSGGAFETGLRRFSGANSIKVLKDSGNRRPVAGNYSGYLRFTATAQ